MYRRILAWFPHIHFILNDLGHFLHSCDLLMHPTLYIQNRILDRLTSTLLGPVRHKISTNNGSSTPWPLCTA